MPAPRPVAAIRADLTAIDAEIAEQGRREAAERASACGGRCTDAIRKGDAAKDSRASLRAELAIGLDAARVDSDLAAAKASLDGGSAPGAADPQAAALAAYVPLAGFTERRAALMLPSLIVEFGGPICFLIAGAFFGLAREYLQAKRALTAPAAEAAPAVEAHAELRACLPSPAPARQQANLVPSMSGAEIGALRAALGEGQEAFAARFGVNVRTLRRWENGERAVSREAVLRARAPATDLRQPALAAA